MRSLFFGRVLVVVAMWTLCAAEGRLAAEAASAAGKSCAIAPETPFLAVEDMWCLDLFARVARERKDNLCLSPLSLNMAMVLCWRGASGRRAANWQSW